MNYLKNENDKIKEIYGDAVEILISEHMKEKNSLDYKQGPHKSNVGEVRYGLNLVYLHITNIIKERMCKKEFIKTIRRLEEEEYKKEEYRSEYFLYFLSLMIDMLLCG